jgi:hypothetical protein
MIEEVVVAVPQTVQALYVVPTSQPPGDLMALAVEVAARLESPLRDLLEQALSGDLLAVQTRPAGDLPAWPVDLLRAFGAGESALSLLTGASHAVLVQCWFRPGWPPVHEWAARAVAGHLAARLDAPVFDVFVPRLVDADALLRTLPDARRQLRPVDWVLVPQSAGPSGAWLTTKGLARFGLPELQAIDVPPQLAGAWTSVLSGIAAVLLRRWSAALDLSSSEQPAFVGLPAELDVTQNDVAQAYGADPGGDASALVALRLDPTSDLDGESFLTVVAPSSYPASSGEFVAQVCGELLGRAESDIRYVPPSSAMQQAMDVARAGLPRVRSRLLDGGIPLGAELIVKHRLEAPGGAEYVWAFITSWADPDRLVGTSADDAEHDPAVRAGRPVRIDVDAVVDWAIWVDGEGIVEGGFTNAVLDAG